MPTTTAPGHRRSWTYTDDLGHVWRIGVKAIYTFRGAAQGVGGAAAAFTIPRLPKGYRRRAVLCTCAGYPSMWVDCYSKGASLWTTVGWPVTRCVNGLDRAYLSTAKRRPETRPRDALRQLA